MASADTTGLTRTGQQVKKEASDKAEARRRLVVPTDAALLGNVLAKPMNSYLNEADAGKVSDALDTLNK